MKFWSVLAALATFAAHAVQVQADECVVTSTQPCALESLVPSQQNGSAKIFPGGKTRCAFDTGKVGTYATNQTFWFEVFPSPTPDNHKLLIYFQGGGACFDKDTCSYAFQWISPIPTFFSNARDKSHEGVLNRTDPLNPFKDWNIVHIPYCTGDLFVGNQTVPVQDALVKTFFDTITGNKLDVSMHQNGAENTIAALQWALTNFATPSQLVVSGSSAGAIGAQLYASKIGALWNVQPKAIPYAVLPDSFVGFSPHPVSKLLNYFGACSIDLNLASSVVAKCKNESLETAELMTSIMKTIPSADWMMLNSLHDQSQRIYYGAMADGLALAVFNIPSEATYAGWLADMQTTYKAANARFSSFITTTDMHSFLTRSDWRSLTSQSSQLLGPVVDAWLAANAASK